MTQEAIQDKNTDVSARDNAVEAIAQKRIQEREEYEKRLAETRIEKEETETDTSKEQADDVGQSNSEEDAKAEGDKPKDAVAPEFDGRTFEFFDGEKIIRVPFTAKIKVKVNGEEAEQTLDNLTRSYQKGASADKRLEYATLTMREAERRQKELEEKEAELTTKERDFVAKMAKLDAQKESGDLSTDGHKKAAAALLKGLMADDESVAEEQIAEALRALSTPKVEFDEDAILSKADQRVLKIIEKREAERAQRVQADERSKANQWFAVTYSDLYEDPVKFKVAEAMIKKAREENPMASHMELAKYAGEAAREWLGANIAIKQQPKATPKAVTARAKIGEDKKPPSRNDILNEMRQMRGQPPL
jgi:hypothetical protein